MNKPLIWVSAFNIIVCVVIAYWIPTTLINASKQQPPSYTKQPTDTLSELHEAIDQTRALIFQQASQWEQDRLQFNDDRQSINDIILDLGKRLENLEGSLHQQDLPGDQYASILEKEEDDERTISKLNTWKHEIAPLAINKVINDSDQIAAYIKDHVTMSDSKFAEISEIIRLSLVETANAMSSSPDFNNLKEFNQLMSKIVSQKEQRIKQSLSAEQYKQYQQISRSNTARVSQH